MSEYYWIVNPVAHRQAELESQAQIDPALLEVFGPVIIDMTSMMGDEWVCDFCNAGIEIEDEFGDPAMIAAVGSYALCPECMEKTEMAEWFKAGTCNCAGCRVKVEL